MSTKPKTAAKTEEPKNNLIVVQGRLSYPHLFKPQASKDGGEAKYGATVILDKTTRAKDIAKVRAEIDRITAADFKGKKLPPDKLCLKDGSAKPDTDGYSDDVMFVTTSNTRQPQVVGRNPNHPVTDSDDLVYGGAVVNVCFRLWAQDNEYGKRINASLECVQYVGPGDRFGAPPVEAASVFGEIEDDEGLV